MQVLKTFSSCPQCKNKIKTLRKIQGQPAGFPDFYGFKRGSTFITIEFKTEEGKLDKKQKTFLELSKNMDLRSYVVKSEEEILDFLKKDGLM
jgi:glutaredoxin